MPIIIRSLCFFLMLLVFPLLMCASVQAESKPKADAHGGGDGDKKGEEDLSSIFNAGEGEPVFVRMKPVVLPVISDKGAEQLVNIIINLETKDYETAMHLNNNKPRVNDAIIRALYGGLADGSMRNSHALDIMKIKKNVKDTMNQTFGEGSVLEVLIQAVEQRKF